MGRQTARKMEVSGGLVHADVQRNSAGTVQMTTTTSTTNTTVTGTTTTTVLTFTAPDVLAFTSVSLSGSGGGAGNTATFNVIRNGTTLISTSGTAAATTTTSNTLTTPLQGPQYQVQVVANGGSATVTNFSLSREQRWG